MKNLFNVLVIFALGLMMTSCGDDEGSSPNCNFSSGNLTGKIENVDWAFDTGKYSQFEDSDGTTLSINMFSSLDSAADPCSVFGSNDRIFFSMPATLGVTELSFDFSDPNSQTVTLFDEEGFVNVIASDGCIELFTITDTEVTGRMNVSSGTDNFVNGEFTLIRCN